MVELDGRNNEPHSHVHVNISVISTPVPLTSARPVPVEYTSVFCSIFYSGNRITESQLHRMTCAGRDFKYNLHPPPSPHTHTMGKVANQALDQVAQGPVVSCRVSLLAACVRSSLVGHSTYSGVNCSVPRLLQRSGLSRRVKLKDIFVISKFCPRLHIICYHAF